MKQHLLHFFPFLKKEFRKLEESELQSEETFKELFPDEPFELWKLRTIFVYQKSEDNVVKFEVTHKVISTIKESKESVQKLDRKIIKNAKI